MFEFSINNKISFLSAKKYSFSLLLPTISLSFNENHDFASKIYLFSFSIPTSLSIVTSDIGNYSRLQISILGFGFSLTRNF